VKIIDGIINGSAWIVDKTAGIIRRLQTGLAQNYAVMIVVGIVTLISYVLIF
jgi:NADH-quinone oxidoreductase subunit L